MVHSYLSNRWAQTIVIPPRYIHIYTLRPMRCYLWLALANYVSFADNKLFSFLRYRSCQNNISTLSLPSSVFFLVLYPIYGIHALVLCFMYCDFSFMNNFRFRHHICTYCTPFRCKMEQKHSFFVCGSREGFCVVVAIMYKYS